jgi:outer membrane lipoprotein-sorting protein
MELQTRRRALRWSAPVVAVAAVAVAASGVLTADANPPLPPRTAAQLLADLQTAQVQGMSGTIVQNAKLGLPQLPNVGNAGNDASLTSLLAGSHTLRVWSAGPDKHRVALLGTLGETDVIHNGRDVWLWESATKTAEHFVLPTGTEAKKPDITDHTGMTPQEAADAALKAIDPTTAVSTDGTASVAGRSAYELVLTPKDSRSLVGQLRIALDAQTHIPLRVRAYAKGNDGSPAYEVGFTRISIATPGDDEFRFTPPPGTTVKQGQGSPADKTGMPAGADGDAKIVGKGWTAVAVIPGFSLPAADGSSTRTRDANPLTAILNRLPKVSGSWGSGRLLSGTLFSALLTDDGRLLVGSVAPDVLYQAAGHR